MEIYESDSGKEKVESLERQFGDTIIQAFFKQVEIYQ